MTVDALVLVYCLGAATLAVWIDSRFPSLGPRDLRSALVRVAGILVLGWLVGPAIAAALAAGTSPAAVVVGIVLPALTLLFLAALWTMRTVQALLPGVRR